MNVSILVVDIGNTRTQIGVYVKNKLQSTCFLQTKDIMNDEKHSLTMLQFLQKSNTYDLQSVIISSVVPKAIKPFVCLIQLIKKVPCLVVGKDIYVPIKNAYKNPAEVGQDRLIGAYEAYTRYQKKLIIIDYGTAITFDYVSSHGTYEGGIIFPGMSLSYSNLLSNAAMLPSVSLQKPKTLIGKQTDEAMFSGVYYGTAALTDGLIERIKKKYGDDVMVIATGGQASAIKRYTLGIDKVEKDLLMEGLYRLYQTL